MCKYVYSAEDLKVEGYHLLMSEIQCYVNLDKKQFRDFVRICAMLSYCKMLGIISSEGYDFHLANVSEMYMEE